MHHSLQCRVAASTTLVDTWGIAGLVCHRFGCSHSECYSLAGMHAMLSVH
jgi:hypothetical protein